jgi:hypothetical protein
LQLLPNLGSYVLVARIEIAKMPLESVDLIKREVAFAERLHAIHNIKEPAARLRRLIPEEERSLPLRKDEFLRANETVLHDMNLA